MKFREQKSIKRKKKMLQTTYRGTEEDLKAVRKLGRKLGVSKSEVIRTAISLLALTHNV